MEQTSLSLTVYFEEPFWRGLYERRMGESYEVCKVTYGAEPKEQMLYRSILHDLAKLDFAEAEAGDVKRLGQNPKRRQRQIAKQMHALHPSTKAQAALSAERQRAASVRQNEARERREAERDKRFAIKCAKRKARHNGH